MKILIPQEILRGKNRDNFNLYLTEIAGDQIKVEMYNLHDEKVREEKYFSREKILTLNPKVLSFIENYDKRLTKLIL